MTRRPSLGVLILVVILVLFVGSGILLAATVAVTGVARVEVEDAAEGVSWSLPVPALFLEGGALVASVVLPDEELARIRVELGDVEPVIRAMLEELESVGDVVLVEVREGHDHVKVETRGGSLVVLVDEPGTRVHVSMPLASVRRGAGYLFG